MSNITIYHNPACGTSRNTLEMIRNSGIEPTVIQYYETPPSRDELLKLIAVMGISVRALLRKNVEPYEELGLAGVVSENGIYGHSRFCNTDFDDKLACLNLSGV